jgi:UDP-N-acetyl-D-glucosamine dehydrogenase
MKKTIAKIINKTAKIAIIGQGYVGFPLAVEFAKAGFSVTGIDVSEKKIDLINQGISFIPDVKSEDIVDVIREKKLTATTNFSTLGDMNVVIICVPTPLSKTREPDVSFIVGAVRKVSKHLKPRQLIVLESTTYPGTTEECVLPMLEERGMVVGQDFYLAFSPERVDPGNPVYKTKNVPKVVGGVTAHCTEVASVLYENCVEKVVSVSSPQVAEMAKLLENTFRSVNIGLVNEMALLCDKMGIDIWEAISAASTKPFGYMPFYPGPGLGGHCIPIDPLYLSWKARSLGFEPRFIELADTVNRYMPYHVVNKIADALNGESKSVRGSSILIIGVAYKRDIDDVRESPALDIIGMLQKKGAQISYYDPLVKSISLDGLCLSSESLSRKLLERSDCVVILADHSGIDYQEVAEHSTLIVDTRNILKNFSKKHIIKL